MRSGMTAWNSAGAAEAADELILNGESPHFILISSSNYASDTHGQALSTDLIPYVDDPAFGWRSRLLDADELHQVVEVVSVPWSPLLPEIRVDLGEIRATRYSSVQQHLERIGRADRLGRWREVADEACAKAMEPQG